MKPGAHSPQRVPVLTEVVVMPEAPPEVEERYPEMASDPAFAPTAPTPLGDWPSAAENKPVAAPAAVAVDEAVLVQRVLADLDKQLDLMFEQRLRETLAPVLTRLTDSLVREMRSQLAASLRDMVARAVSLEIDKLQRR